MHCLPNPRTRFKVPLSGVAEGRFSFDLSAQQQADNSLNVIDAYFAVAVDIAAEELLHVKCGMLDVI